jgi:hypothetical protein
MLTLACEMALKSQKRSTHSLSAFFNCPQHFFNFSFAVSDHAVLIKPTTITARSIFNVILT